MRLASTPLRLIFGAVILAAPFFALPQARAETGTEEMAEEPDLASFVPEPPGYKTSDYRSPVPGTIAGGAVIDTTDAKRLFDEGVPFIDVLPRAPKPKGLPEGTIWREKPRDNIPGSLWLVDTGYGELAPVMQRYFLDGLSGLVGGDKSRPVVIYCLRDCWMSYNAAKRAIADGYTAVHWYPEGTDGWAEAGLPLERGTPIDRPDD